MKEKVYNIISNYVDEDFVISGTHKLFDDLGLSSFDMMNILIILENQLGVNLTIYDMIEIKTVDNLLELVNKEVSK